MHALVVDDSRVLRRIVARVVSTLGFEVLEAGNGLEALQQLREHGGVSLALVDWTMPEMDGLQLVRTVRAEPGHDDLLVMMLTALSGTDDVAAALSAGADEYIMKPFDAEIIVLKLAEIGVG